MRNFIILTICLIFLVGSGILQLSYLNSSSKYLISDVEYIQNLVDNNKFKEAKEHYENLNKTWNNMSNIWCIFIHHNETEALKEYMVNFERYIDLKNKENIYVMSGQITNKLESIIKKQNICIDNVF